MRKLWLGSLILSFASTVAAQDGASSTGVAAVPVEAVAAPSVAVVGASLSAGAALAKFGIQAKPKYRGETIGLGAVLAKLYPEGAVTDVSDTWFFSAPVKRGPKQAEVARSAAPDLVYAVDFLFWFGYGGDAPEGTDRPKSSEVEAWRLEKQAKGFALIDELRAATGAVIVLGDYPDMSEANPLMLPKKLIPSYATLDELNVRIAAFAAERDDVHLFPLADLVFTMTEEGESVEVGGESLDLERDHLMQLDKLHPTKLGAAVLGDHLTRWLARQLAEDQPGRLAPPGLEELLELTGGDAVLAEIRDS